MENKYRIDFYRTIDVGYDYLDYLEDTFYNLIDSASEEELQVILEGLKMDTETLLVLEDSLNMFLENNLYQEASDQLIILEIAHMMIRDILPGDDLDCIEEYLDSLDEEQFIEYITRVIDRYNDMGGKLS